MIVRPVAAVESAVANVFAGQTNSKSSSTAAVWPASVRSLPRAVACSFALNAPRASAAGAGAGGDLRGRCLRVEVLEQELGRLAEVGVGELVVGRGQSSEGVRRRKPGHGESRAGGGEDETSSVHAWRALLVNAGAAGATGR